jgi:CheY-like chemotaxis protein
MDKSGPIIIIDDSEEDQRIYVEIFKDLNFENELLFYSDGTQALEFLNKTEKVPFLVISDINMPKMNGFELRAQIYENQKLSIMCVPFLFFSTGVDKKAVYDAYAMSVQGFFRKPMSYDDLSKTMKNIMVYWKECIAPNDYNVA